MFPVHAEERVIEIQIWDVSSKKRLYAPLRLHQSWVRDIQFSKDNIRMVTVGDKIAWWSLDFLTEASSTRRQQQVQNRRSSVTSALSNPFQRRKRSTSECLSPGFSPTKKEDRKTHV